MGVIYAFVTGERHTAESTAFGNFAEAGWVDPRYSMRELFDSRNDVSPIFKEWEQHDSLPDILRCEDFDQRIREVLADTLGAYEDNGDGTFYASDTKIWEYESGDSYSYAVHFTLKDSNGERDWHPSEAGIEL